MARNTNKVVPSRKPEPVKRHVEIDMDDDDVEAFITEYLKDFDEYNAGLRMSWPRAGLSQRVRSVLYSSAVQARLQERVDALHVSELSTPGRIVMRLLQEASSPTNKGATRVAALRSLREVYKIDATKPKGKQGSVRGGVMLVPTATLEDWEAAAAKQQAELMKEVRK